MKRYTRDYSKNKRRLREAGEGWEEVVYKGEHYFSYRILGKADEWGWSGEPFKNFDYAEVLLNVEIKDAHPLCKDFEEIKIVLVRLSQKYEDDSEWGTSYPATRWDPGCGTGRYQIDGYVELDDVAGFKTIEDAQAYISRNREDLEVLDSEDHGLVSYIWSDFEEEPTQYLSEMPDDYIEYEW